MRRWRRRIRILMMPMLVVRVMMRSRPERVAGASGIRRRVGRAECTLAGLRFGQPGPGRAGLLLVVLSQLGDHKRRRSLLRVRSLRRHRRGAPRRASLLRWVLMMVVWGMRVVCCLVRRRWVRHVRSGRRGGEATVLWPQRILGGGLRTRRVSSALRRRRAITIAAGFLGVYRLESVLWYLWPRRQLWLLVIAVELIRRRRELIVVRVW